MEQSTGKSSDAELTETFLKDRSERNFLAIYRRYSVDMYRLANHFVGYSEILAKDALQETWVTVVQKIELFEGRSSFKTWLTGILINKCRELHKEEKRNDHDELSNAMQNSVNHTVAIKMDLRSAIGQLSNGYRKVLVLHHAEGYTHTEIAALLGINEGTSKSQLFHARNIVRKYLNDAHE